MTFTLKQVAALVAAAMLIALGVGVAFRSFSRTELAAAARQHHHLTIRSAYELQDELTDAETGQRGFALTGNEAFLEPYLAVRDAITGHLAALRGMVHGTAAQVHAAALAPLVHDKLAEMARIIELRRKQDLPAVTASVASGEGKRLMDAIRGEISGLVTIEEGELALREAAFQWNLRRLFGIIVGASVFALLFALLFACLIYQHSRRRLENLVLLETRHLLGIQEKTSHQLQHANLTLRASEEQLAVTLSSIGDAVLATDVNACVTSLNPVAEKLTGWSQAEAFGRPVGDIFHIINKETRQPAVVPVTETLAKGTVQGLANHTVLIARHGSECDIADSCAPIRDRDGEVIGAVLVFRDVTGEYAVQQALRDQQFYTRSLIESNIDAIITTDPSGIISDVNNQMEILTGRSRDELIGAPFKDCFTDPAQAGAAIKRVLIEGKVSDFVLTARSKDGKETVVSYNATNFYDHDGVLQGVFAAARDVTERNRLDHALQENTVELEKAKAVAEKANQAKSDFLSSMSHELRSPLNAILGFAQLMDSDTPPPSPAQKGSIDQILHAGWYLLELINEILDLAVVESGRLTLSLEPVSLSDVLIECQAMIEPQALKRGISMTFPQFVNPCYISADHTRVKQVLINLLSNAIKYNQADGSVSVACETPAAGRVRISVTDTGAGLSPENIAQLFQPFNRLGQESGGEEGTGIGLVVSKRLVELMHGEIGVASTVGAGSVFWIELDADHDPHAGYMQAALTMTHDAAIPAGLRTRLVLYVEDNPANLNLIEQLIARRPDMRLLTAQNGKDGINLARASMPDVILMDINLPGISGVEAMKILHQDAATAHIPIVALSANAIPRDIEKGLAAGFFRYLTKPIKVNEFFDTLEVALEFAAGSEARLD